MLTTLSTLNDPELKLRRPLIVQCAPEHTPEGRFWAVYAPKVDALELDPTYFGALAALRAAIVRRYRALDDLARLGTLRQGTRYWTEWVAYRDAVTEVADEHAPVLDLERRGPARSG